MGAQAGESASSSGDKSCNLSTLEEVRTTLEQELSNIRQAWKTEWMCSASALDRKSSFFFQYDGTEETALQAANRRNRNKVYWCGVWNSKFHTLSRAACTRISRSIPVGDHLAEGQDFCNSKILKLTNEEYDNSESLFERRLELQTEFKEAMALLGDTVKTEPGIKEEPVDD